MNQEKLNEIVRLHGLWLRNEEGGERAGLRNADLRGANLLDADLRGANLQDANLQGANLIGVRLRGANLRDAWLLGADLSGADIRRASLRGANLQDADLRGADLLYANLQGANLRGADLSGADLSGARKGPAYYSISWSGHGEMGRRLHAVEQDGQLMFSCGCFSGSESHLREYIKDGDQDYAASRLRALEIILELYNNREVK